MGFSNSLLSGAFLFVESGNRPNPQGNFFMGRKNGTTNENPIHNVWLDSYSVAKYPVTNREYAIFVVEIMKLYLKLNLSATIWL